MTVFVPGKPFLPGEMQHSSLLGPFIDRLQRKLSIAYKYPCVGVTFGQLAILSTCHFVNLPFCQLAILSTKSTIVFYEGGRAR